MRVATAVAGDEQSGADAVHDAFVQAVRKRRSFRGEGPLLDYESIAATLGVSSGTVGATLNAAHAALRNSLKEAHR